MADADQVLAGIHAVESALHQQPGRLRRLWLLSGRQDQRIRRLLALARDNGVPAERLDSSTFQQRLTRLGLGDVRHQGVIAEVQALVPGNESDLERLVVAAECPLFLVLDGVTDPHNLGACLRTADATGVTAVIVPQKRSAGLTATVARVASGAAETVPLIQVTNLSRALKTLKAAGVWLTGLADTEDSALYEADFSGPSALILGAEGEGVRRLTREHCDFLVRIPMAGTVSSLNVSVAAGVCLYEAVRQRR